jgi:hypothetical protein
LLHWQDFEGDQALTPDEQRLHHLLPEGPDAECSFVAWDLNPLQVMKRLPFEYSAKSFAHSIVCELRRVTGASLSVIRPLPDGQDLQLPELE